METSLQLANILKGRNRFLEPTTPSKRAEVYYRDALADFVKKMVNDLISKMRKDALTDAAPTDEDYISALIESLSILSSANIEASAKSLATRFAAKAQYQNKEQFKRNFNRAFGIDIGNVIDNEMLTETLAAAVAENTSLIISIKTDFIKDIGSNVLTNLKKGVRHEELIKQIYERGNVSYSRAKLIARDQTAKINADFKEERDKKLGFDVYKWKGTGDIRERDSHFVLNNMLCKYSDPTVYSDDDGETWKKRSSIGAFIGKPGEDIQCRCLAVSKVKF